jgi:hypothetical protein
MTLNNLFNFLLATVLMFFRASVWIFLAVSVYFSVLWLSIEFRGLVFENLCTPPLRRDLIDGRLDWCETWWWHPYRLSIQLIFGSLTALIVMATAWVLLPRRRWVLVSAAAFMIVGAALHTYYFAVVEIFRNNPSTACLYGWYLEDRTVEDCRRLIGPFGDLRFYYPGTVALLSLTLALRFRKTSVLTVKENPVK